MPILLLLILIGGGVWLYRRRSDARRAGATAIAAADSDWPDIPALAAGGAPPPDAAGRIEVSGLSKQYKAVTAVDNLSFVVEPGRVTGFLGPNGAGKTTTLRVLVGLATPTAGTATIGGARYAELPRPVRHVGAILEASAAHKGRTGRNHLRILCQSTGVPLGRADEVLAMVGLTAAGGRKFKEYSLGMRQRLGIAAALIGDPQVLILDEPTNGLDPEGIRWMRDLLKTLAAAGRTVLVSSHLLSEMQLLADDLIIIAAGHLVAHGTVASVVDSIDHSARTLVRTPDIEALTTALAGIATVTPTDNGDVYVTGVDAAAIADAARDAGVTLHQLATERPDLEDVFLALTKGKAAIR